MRVFWGRLGWPKATREARTQQLPSEKKGPMHRPLPHRTPPTHTRTKRAVARKKKRSNSWTPQTRARGDCVDMLQTCVAHECMSGQRRPGHRFFGCTARRRRERTGTMMSGARGSPPLLFGHSWCLNMAVGRATYAAGQRTIGVRTHTHGASVPASETDEGGFDRGFDVSRCWAIKWNGKWSAREKCRTRPDVRDMHAEPHVRVGRGPSLLLLRRVRANEVGASRSDPIMHARIQTHPPAGATASEHNIGREIFLAHE